MTDATPVHHPEPGGTRGGSLPPAVPLPLVRAGRTLAAAGAVLAAAALAVPAWRERLAAGWLWGYLWLWTLTMGGLFFVSLHHATHAVWSVGVRRAGEMFAASAGWGTVFFLPVLAFAAWPRAFPLFEWAGVRHASADPLLAFRNAYLDVPFFIARGLAFQAVGIASAAFFVGRSLRQDRGEGGAAATLVLRRVSAPFLVVFAATVTFASIDWMMSLEPDWHSAIFGVYVFSGMAVSAYAAVTLVTLGLLRAGRLDRDVATEDHLYNLGGMLFTFTCFWAYIAFSQSMLMWYGNMPEEAAYYVRRWAGGWGTAAAWLWILRFGMPFLLLLPRRAKRSGAMLALASALILAGQALDLYWLVMPDGHPAGPALGPAELGPPILMTGALLLFIARFLGRHAPLPVGDPLLEECRRFHL